MSAPLYHGPGAKEAALRHARRPGHRLLVPPVGDDGLKIEEARSVVELLSYAPSGTSVGAVVVGPMDLCYPRSSDTLLKEIEEFNPELVLPILWAYDLGEVSPTIRSRCSHVWSPGEGTLDEELMSQCYQVLAAWEAREMYKIPMVLGAQGRELEWLQTFAAVLSMSGEDRHMKLWSSLRSVAKHSNPTKIEILGALLDG